MLLAVKKINWYMTRLSVMKPIEIVHRIDERLRLHRIKNSQRSKSHWYDTFVKDVSKYRLVKSSQKMLPELKWDWHYSEEYKDKLLDGRVSIFKYDVTIANNKISWHLDPDTGGYWPIKYFSEINYRQGNQFGDIRLAWEASRLQHFLILANIALEKNDHDDKNTESLQAIELLLAQFNLWMTSNQPYIGIHYISVMECALRIITLTHTFDMLRWKLQVSADVWQLLVKLIVNHADLIYNRLSLYSSAGNHTIAECAGLIYAGLLIPEHESAEKWKNKGLKLLTQEVPRQIHSDGGGREQSHWYLLFIVDLIGLVIELLKYHKQSIPDEIIKGFERGKNFLNCFSDTPEKLPRIGDTDNGYALSPYLRISWNGDKSMDSLNIFKDTGYSSFRTNGNSAINLVFDHGSLGMSPSFGHGHADALSVLLKVNGHHLFVDSGTYRYTCDEQWRKYFRGTRAHNTVIVDDTDQSSQQSAFMWKHDYKAQLEKWSNTEELDETDKHVRLLASHDGYKSSGVIHHRAVSINEDNYIIICDFLSGDGEHKLALNWHVPQLYNWQDDNTMIFNTGSPVTMNVQGGVIDAFRGELEPLAGWCSDTYGSKEPITTIQCTYSGTLPHTFITVVNLSGKVDKKDIENEVQELNKWSM